MARETSRREDLSTQKISMLELEEIELAKERSLIPFMSTVNYTLGSAGLSTVYETASKMTGLLNSYPGIFDTSSEDNSGRTPKASTKKKDLPKDIID